MKKIVLTIISGVILAVVFFSAFFVNKSLAYKPIILFKNYLRMDFYKENLSLKLENENLKAQLDQIKSLANLSSYGFEGIDRSQYIEVRIFSTYPFNVKDIVIIDKGMGGGVKKGMTAALGENILFGQVVEVEKDFSKVRTIFDSNWQIPVKIGEEKINGLFKGGNNPNITLIEKPVQPGDAVFAVSKDFPAPMKIGNINEVKKTNGGILEEATVKTVYNINELEYIQLLKN